MPTFFFFTLISVLGWTPQIAYRLIILQVYETVFVKRRKNQQTYYLYSMSYSLLTLRCWLNRSMWNSNLETHVKNRFQQMDNTTITTIRLPPTPWLDWQFFRLKWRNDDFRVWITAKIVTKLADSNIYISTRIHH